MLIRVVEEVAVKEGGETEEEEGKREKIVMECLGFDRWLVKRTRVENWFSLFS